MDVKFTHLNCVFWDDDYKSVGPVLDELHLLEKEARDWEAKNKLRVYDALFQIYNRKLKDASENLIQSINSFQDIPILDYNH